MANFAQEGKIAEDYMQEIDNLLDKLSSSGESGGGSHATRAAVVHRLKLLDQHVLELKKQFPDEDLVALYESLVHFYRGRLTLFSENFLGDVLVQSTRKSTGVGEAILLGFLAKEQVTHSFKQAARKAVAH